ncbi:HMG domain-containing protein 4 [Amphibalanus amphitrite]|uniref:HMG domain-containing protein 4 n=1 Tax=Amphibalanus amphitrite TaxID=1232801 RepID=A0A6A4X694_AMPAM|nr:HMG domain-containing protein 4 [Amphibalanus amphitrite]
MQYVDSGDVSRSGRVRKRSSKLADYDPTDDLDVKPSRKERRDSGQYSKRKTKVMVTPTAPDMKAEPHDDLGSEDELQGYEVDGYDTSGGAAAYDGGQPRISAYLLWAREVRDFVAQANPDMDFSQINKRLGAMWNTLPDAKKYCTHSANFKRRAQRINGRHNVLEASGSSAKMKSTGKGPKGRPSKKALEGAAEAATSEMGGKHPSMPPPSMSEATSLVNPTNYRVCTTQPIDLAAHMVLLGESLGVIGQKLRDHDGQIAVSGSLSVLLDSLLCALVPLVALTKQVPELDGCDDRDLIKTLDNIAYFMPGL